VRCADAKHDCCSACHAACQSRCRDGTASTCDACSDGWQPDGFGLLNQACKGNCCKQLSLLEFVSVIVSRFCDIFLLLINLLSVCYVCTAISSLVHFQPYRITEIWNMYHPEWINLLLVNFLVLHHSEVITICLHCSTVYDDRLSFSMLRLLYKAC